MMVISITDDDDKLYKPKQPSVTNKIARNGRNTGVANLNCMIIIFMTVIMAFENLNNMMIKIYMQN